MGAFAFQRFGTFQLKTAQTNMQQGFMGVRMYLLYGKWFCSPKAKFVLLCVVSCLFMWALRSAPLRLSEDFFAD